jgi:hypothetical protein
MANLLEIVKTQWHDIKGNAKWDFIKWGIIGVTFFPAMILGFVRGAPLWEVIIVLFGTAKIEKVDKMAVYLIDCELIPI